MRQGSLIKKIEDELERLESEAAGRLNAVRIARKALAEVIKQINKEDQEKGEAPNAD